MFEKGEKKLKFKKSKNTQLCKLHDDSSQCREPFSSPAGVPHLQRTVHTIWHWARCPTKAPAPWITLGLFSLTCFPMNSVSIGIRHPQQTPGFPGLVFFNVLTSFPPLPAPLMAGAGGSQVFFLILKLPILCHPLNLFSNHSVLQLSEVPWLLTSLRESSCFTGLVLRSCWMHFLSPPSSCF